MLLLMAMMLISLSELAFPVSALASRNLPPFTALSSLLSPPFLSLSCVFKDLPLPPFILTLFPVLPLTLCVSSPALNFVFPIAPSACNACNVVIHQESWICENAKGDKVFDLMLFNLSLKINSKSLPPVFYDTV